MHGKFNQETDSRTILTSLCGDPGYGFANGDVCIWQLRISEIPLQPQLELLAEAELSRAERIQHIVSRKNFIKSRGVLRTILSKFTGETPKSLTIIDDDCKPYIPAHSELAFSLSRSSEYLIVAVCKFAIGVDIEKVRGDLLWHPIAQHYFHSSEKDALETCSSMSKREAFYQIWTQKEAFLKAVGKGLDRDLNSFAVPLRGGDVCDANVNEPNSQWHTFVLETIPGSKLALAHQSPNTKVFQFGTATINSWLEVPETVRSVRAPYQPFVSKETRLCS